MLDLFEKPVTKDHHTRKLDFGDALLCVTLVSTDSFVLVVVPEDGVSAVRIAIVERIAVAAGILWVIGLDNLPMDDAVANAVLNIFNDRMTHRRPMVEIPSK